MISSDMKADVTIAHDSSIDIVAGEKKTPGRKKCAPASLDDSPVGQVLRTAYKRTVDEAIPSEMLDLLSKLD